MPNFQVTFNCKGYGLIAMTVPAENAEKAVPLARTAAKAQGFKVGRRSLYHPVKEV